MKVRKIVIARGIAEDSVSLPAGVDYWPDAPAKPVVLWHGNPGKDRAGAGLSAADALKPLFVRMINHLGAQWFVTVLEDLAKGTTISVEDIQARGEQATGRQPELILEEMYP